MSISFSRLLRMFPPHLLLTGATARKVFQLFSEVKEQLWGGAFWSRSSYAHQWYFQDIYGEDGRKPEEPQQALELTAEEVLRLVVMPDEQGRYHFDEMGYENLPELVGYMGGPPAPGEAMHYRNQQAQQEYFCSNVG